jgi:ABC-type phosphate/phosphonate transport system permease subunit
MKPWEWPTYGEWALIALAAAAVALTVTALVALALTLTAARSLREFFTAPWEVDREE